jgi:hypothetical protein
MPPPPKAVEPPAPPKVEELKPTPPPPKLTPAASTKILPPPPKADVKPAPPPAPRLLPAASTAVLPPPPTVLPPAPAAAPPPPPPRAHLPVSASTFAVAPPPPPVPTMVSAMPPPPPNLIRVSSSATPPVIPARITPAMSALPPPVQLTLSPPPVRQALIRTSDTVAPTITELGEIRGRACEKSCEIVRLEVPIEYRMKMNATVKCEGECLSVQEVRGAGKYAEVVLMIDSRRSIDTDFQVHVDAGAFNAEGQGHLVIERPTPYVLGMQTVCGGQQSAECPLKEELWQRKPYKAFFEPKLKEFWLSQNKGFIEAGAKVFPFKVFFAPKDPRPIEALLVVDCGDVEITVKVCGSTAGFQGANWGRRKHGGG